MRIAVGGIGHETNTFSTLRTTLRDFNVRRGQECVQGEVFDRCRADGIAFAPTLIAGATPNGFVERSAYETLKAELLEQLRAQMPVHGVYLALHGAMEVADLGDGETDLTAAVRQMVGPHVPISISLDLHGNLSPEFVASANILTALRTAPHVDAPQTRARALLHLVRSVRERRLPVTQMVKLPMILPGEWAVTTAEPSRSLYRRLFEIEHLPGIWDASLMIACAWTDSPYTGVSTLAVGDDKFKAQAQANALAERVWERRAEFGPEVETVSMEAAIDRALKFEGKGTVFISDSGDNVTAGGAGDVPVFIEYLLAAKAPDVLVAGITDADAVSQCETVGIGGVTTLRLGGKLDQVNGKPLAVRGTVICFEGSTAVFQSHGITIVLIDQRQPFHTLESFARCGIDPLSRRIVVVKQGYLAPELRARAALSVIALSPGFTDQRLDQLQYARLRRPIYPLDRI